MLKKIDQSEIDKLDETQRQNLMVNAEGEYVFAQADEKTWRKHLEQQKAAEAAQKKVQAGDKELQERGLECSLDKRLFVDPMKTPCCGKTYCHDCIENALIENDLTCPGCGTENVSLERLEPDEDTKVKIKTYESEKSGERQNARSPTASAASPQADGSASGSRPGTSDGSKSPKSDTTQSKKRRADEAVDGESNNISAPAMKRQRSGEQVPSSQPDGKSTTPANVNNMNMPFNMMPPDMSNMMQNMPMNFPMQMPGMPFMMPGMMNPAMGMNMMPGMNFMQPNFNPMMNAGMNGSMFPNNNSFTPMMNGAGYNSSNNYQYQNQSQPRNLNKPPPKGPSQPPGLSGVPTAPKAMQQSQTGTYPPTGPAGNKFSNQQRHVGNEEDNAYMRQPVNPHRHQNRGKRARQADYREL